MTKTALLLVSFWTVPWDPHPADSPLLGDCASEHNPFAYAFDEQGRVVPIASAFLEQARRARGRAKVVPTVVNDVLGPGGKAVELKSRGLLEKILSPERAAAHAAELAALVEAGGFDGVEIDYERVPARLWGDYTRFVETLSARLRQKGKRLNVALEPGLLHRPKDLALARAHWPRLARCADSLRLMCYYERGERDAPGPGNSLEWVEETARRALELVGPEKLAVALSLAGTSWSSPAGEPGARRVRRLHYGQVLKLLDSTGAELSRDGAPHFAYSDGDGSHEVWFEDERSLREKVEALSALGVRQVSIWYLGGRHPDLKSSGLCLRSRSG